jgi:hypothetical protein
MIGKTLKLTLIVAILVSLAGCSFVSKHKVLHTQLDHDPFKMEECLLVVDSLAGWQMEKQVEFSNSMVKQLAERGSACSYFIKTPEGLNEVDAAHDAFMEANPGHVLYASQIDMNTPKEDMEPEVTFKFFVYPSSAWSGVQAAVGTGSLPDRRAMLDELAEQEGLWSAVVATECGTVGRISSALANGTIKALSQDGLIK